MEGKRKHYYVLLPGDFYPLDAWARNEEEARAQIREWLGVRRLPRGTQVWRSDCRGTWDVEFAFLRG